MYKVFRNESETQVDRPAPKVALKPGVYTFILIQQGLGITSLKNGSNYVREPDLGETLAKSMVLYMGQGLKECWGS